MWNEVDINIIPVRADYYREFINGSQHMEIAL